MTFASISPTTGQQVWTGKAADQAAVDAAIASARKALAHWSSLSPLKRVDHLLAFKTKLAQNKDKLASTISEETGKPLWESRSEVDAMIGKIDISIDAYAVRCNERIQLLPSGQSITRHKPHGVIAVLGPFNFPGHLPNGHIVPSLLAGNCIVFKPSELTPLVAEKTVELWQQSGLPNGVLNLVQGGKATGENLASHPGLNGLFFTGSAAAGKSLLQLFSDSPDKILALEMGGNNPLIVSQITDFKTAAYLTIVSAFLTSGQRCTCARRLIVPIGNVGDLFLDALIDLAKQIRIGRFDEVPEPFMGPLIQPQAVERVLTTQQNLIDRGAKALLEAKRLTLGPAFLSSGIVDVSNVARTDEEIFGPFLQLIRVTDFERAILEANNTRYGLSAGLLSDNKAEYDLFYRSIHAGAISWNAPTTGASSQMPFGGIGWSGNHRPSAYYAADYCAYPVASMESPKLQVPTKKLPGLLE